MTASHEFEIKPAANGGIIVSNIRNDAPGRMPELIGAFTTPADMLAWLAEQYGVPVAIGVDVAEVPGPGEWHPGVLDEISGESVIPVRRVKEVSPTPTCDGWSNWNGGERPVDATTIVDVKLRDGRKLTTFLAANVEWGRSEKKPYGDVIAYRLA